MSEETLWYQCINLYQNCIQISKSDLYEELNLFRNIVAKESVALWYSEM